MAGAVAISAGGNLVNHTLIAEANFAEFEQIATSYTEAVKKARS
ncbi:hypothetical protein P4284_05540 [Bacillus swezeyi]|nr:hypothetical protein [Bacillus swezeyi]MED1742259.1 hypothetical protein [Bacillus swezeyi]MED2944942.1 hypothetical protein [Bacillus swezeyi]MED2976180.1 hypothetical protein [Bacillus swezeyi]